MDREKRIRTLEQILEYALRDTLEETAILHNAFRTIFLDNTDITLEEFDEAFANVASRISEECTKTLMDDLETENSATNMFVEAAKESFTSMWQEAVASENPEETVKHRINEKRCEQMMAKISEALGESSIHIKGIELVENPDT